ncbi:MAG: substrate-binding domain-containing protein [Chitinivibrionales bacterium]|nr:substrate-binding domain-containing protein [Chitinivibrionales bacterium]
MPSYPASQAYQYLSRIVDGLADKPNIRLPSLRTLAREAGVSRMTMQLAMQRLRRQGKVVVYNRRDGARIAVPHAMPLAGTVPKISIAEREYRFETVKRLITQDIISGVYREKQKLPTLKELQFRFGDCYQTIFRAVSELKNSGLIQPSGRRFAVTPSARLSRSTLYFFCDEESLPPNRHPMGERLVVFFRLIEAECKRASLKIRFIPLGDRTKKSLLKEFKEYKNSAVGAIIWCHSHFELNDEILRFLIPFRRPISFIDLWNYYPFYRKTHPRVSPTVRFFSIDASGNEGRDVGNLLLQSGHRKIAYFSIYQSESWSIKRYAGLAQAFSAAGLPRSIGAYTSDDYDLHLEAPLSSFDYLNQPDWKKLINIDGIIKRKHLSSFEAASFYQAVEWAYRGCKLALFYKPLFKRALADPAITAWVAANDETAFAAMDFLAAARRRVPADMALVSFDDDFNALFRNLSSYNFNLSGLLHQALEHLLRPSFPSVKQADGPVEIRGYVVQRGSLGEA